MPDVAAASLRKARLNLSFLVAGAPSDAVCHLTIANHLELKFVSDKILTTFIVFTNFVESDIYIIILNTGELCLSWRILVFLECKLT